MGKRLRTLIERMWAFSSAQMPLSLAARLSPDVAFLWISVRHVSRVKSAEGSCLHVPRVLCEKGLVDISKSFV